jgi:hypothetical protein
MAPQPPTMWVTAVCLWLLLSASQLHAGNHIVGKTLIISPCWNMMILLALITKFVGSDFMLIIFNTMYLQL